MAETLERPGARVVLHRDAPSRDGLPTAALGSVAFDSAESGAALLEEACARLAADGVPRVVGPMDGDTWHSYRLILETDGTPAFTMEPTSGPHDLSAFRAAGFDVIDTYASARARLPDALGPAPAPAAVDIIAWDGQGAQALFGEIHALTLEAFADNPFFRPVSRTAFLEMTTPMMPMLQPEMLLLARDARDGALLGYLLGLPDFSDPAGTTVILKTYASRRHGIGHHLAHAFHTRVHAAGYTHVIHALMHDRNTSMARSAAHAGRVFRRYALMGRRLEHAGDDGERGRAR